MPEPIHPSTQAQAMGFRRKLSPETESPRGHPIVLAFSGGLDTSFLVPWLAQRHQRPIVTVTVDTGGLDARPENLSRPARWRSAQPGTYWWTRGTPSSTIPCATS